jgi:hypothetical protein
VEQEKGEATPDENLPPVSEKCWHEFSSTFHAPVWNSSRAVGF